MWLSAAPEATHHLKAELVNKQGNSKQYSLTEEQIDS